MYPRELLLVAGILLLVFLGRREHLAFTDTVKDIRTTIDPTEQDRIFAMAPASLQSAARQASTDAGYRVDQSKQIVARIVRDFQTGVYVSATSPITEAMIDSFVSTKRSYYQSTPSAADGDVYVTAYGNGDAKRLLMSYFNIRAAGTIPPLSSVPTSSTSTVSIPKLLEQMRDNLLDYKMTGQSEYKASYDGIKAWLDQYIANINLQLATEADSITNDVSTYQSANPEMTQMQTEFQRVKTEGPKAEDTYQTIRRQMGQGPPPEDSTNLYVKGGIAVGLVLGALALSVF